MLPNGLFVIALISFTSLISPGESVDEKERFSNFYAAPDNLDLIAMASEHRSPSLVSRSAPPSPPSERLNRDNQRQHPPRQSPRNSASTDDDEPRFSIGLGTLAPSYSQKFGIDGRTRLDFDHHKNGFSYSLTNNHHDEPQEQSSSYADTPQESKAEFTLHPSVDRMGGSLQNSQQPVDHNVKIYYNQRFSPSLTAETSNHYSHIPYPRNDRVNSYEPQPRPYQGEGRAQSRFQELVEKYAPRGGESIPEYRDEQPSRSYNQYSEGPYDRPADDGHEHYQGRMHDDNGPPRSNAFNEFGSDFDSSPELYTRASSDDDRFNFPSSNDDSYTYPLPFQHKSGSMMNSGPKGFEYINRISSSHHDSFNSGLEPVVFSTNIGRYSGLDNHDAFSAYIAGLPFTP